MCNFVQTYFAWIVHFGIDNNRRSKNAKWYRNLPIEKTWKNGKFGVLLQKYFKISLNKIIIFCNQYIEFKDLFFSDLG